MPGLEEVFDLRPNGTWSRRMQESPMEKTVEITIRRWQPASLSLSHALPTSYPGCAPQLSSVGSFAPYHLAAAAQAHSCWPQHQQPPPYSAPAHSGWPQHQQPPPYSAPAAQNQSAEEQAATMRLSRLECALSAMKPQIEALLVAQQPKSHSHIPVLAPGSAGAAVPAKPSVDETSPSVAARTAAGMYVSDDGMVLTTAGVSGQPELKRSETANTSSSQSDAFELRSRRNMVTLQIQTTPKDKRQEKKMKAATAPPAVVKIGHEGDSEGQASAEEAGGRASGEDVKTERPKDAPKQRPAVQVQTLRIAPSAMDPESPRSPGRYSAWK